MGMNVSAREDLAVLTVMNLYHNAEAILVKTLLNVSKFPDLLNANVQMV
jgi:hypothetical protein